MTDISNQSTPMLRVHVRAAKAEETYACRMLMPEGFTPTSAPELFVAVTTTSPSAVVGAAAVGWRQLSKPPGFPVQIHVIAPLRRRGIGRALLAAVTEACRGETDLLHAWTMLSDESAGAAFLRREGFETRQRFLNFEADGKRFHAMVDALRNRMSRSGKIPEGVRTVPLKDAPADEVVALVATTFDALPAFVAAKITAEGISSYDVDNSMVLMADGKVEGALLYIWKDGVPMIDVNVVSEPFRRGWANVLLLEATTRGGLATGADRFRFSCDQHNRDTINLAKRVSATPLGAEAAFMRSLGR